MEEFTGIDIMDGPGVTKVGNAHALDDFRPSCFDLVLCMNVIEHDTDPAATIKEARRVLKKGKPFILTVAPGRGWLSSRTIPIMNCFCAETKNMKQNKTRVSNFSNFVFIFTYIKFFMQITPIILIYINILY
jgi:ubiquinone/menaquinone biosynthesis C-methylase UbiE